MKGIIPSCNIHTVEEETLGRGLKDGGKEELGEEEWVLLNTLSLRKTKIWQDYSTSLELKRGEERGFFVWRKRRVRRGRVSLTQYLESQEDQDMIRLLNFTRTQERRRKGVFCVLLEWRRGGVYIVVVEKIWMEGHLMRVDKESWT